MSSTALVSAARRAPVPDVNATFDPSAEIEGWPVTPPSTDSPRALRDTSTTLPVEVSFRKTSMAPLESPVTRLDAAVANTT